MKTASSPANEASEDATYREERYQWDWTST